MLGTNDAKDAAWGVPNWQHASCDGRDIAVLRRECPFWQGYEAILRVLRRLEGGVPAVFVAIPPPVVNDGGFSINATVVNSLLPWMVPAIADSVGLPDGHVIDLFSALGGHSGAPLPLSGCTVDDASDRAARDGSAAVLRRYAVCRFYCSNGWCDAHRDGRNQGVHPADRGFAQIARVVAGALMGAADALAGAGPSDLSRASLRGDSERDAAGGTGSWLGCLQDGSASDVWPNLTHHWATAGVGERIMDLPIPDSEACRVHCRDRGYLFAGLVWNGPERGPAGYALTQCYCARELGALDPRNDSARLRERYECCPTCLNYDLRPMYEPPCLPDLSSCGAWMRVSAFWLGPPAAAPTLPPPPSPPPFLNNPCDQAPYSSMPWCNASLPLDARSADAVERMTLQEKFAALGTGRSADASAGPSSWAVASLGLREYNWWNEASHGVASHGNTPTTNFVLPLTAAQAFNRTLWHATGRQIGREARAAMNLGRAYSTFWAPVVNLASEPRWGRNLETAGEDPHVAGVYAEHFVRGMQEASEAPQHLMASACCKHYVANQMEHSTVAGVPHDRQEFDARVSSRDLLDSYLPPFHACVERGHVSGLMCSYNAVNGVPTCADSWLLTTLARGEWGFDGYVVTDCGAAADVFERHHYTRTPEEAVGALLRAGTDLDCSGGMMAKHAEAALRTGAVSEADIDSALRRAFRVRMRLAHFEKTALDDIRAANTLCSDHARQLAREGAVQSTALLKNEVLPPGAAGSRRRLPLDDDAARGTVAVIGPNANLSMALAGYYGPGNTCGPHRWPNMVDAVAQHAARTVTAKGVPSPASDDTSGIAEAAALAASVDVVVCVLGTDLSWAREGIDATSIQFTEAQLELVAALGAAASMPIVVVILTATPLDLSPLLADPHVGAILHAGFPTVQAEGVGDVLFGAAGAAPAGRLVQTVYPASFAESVSVFDMNLRPGPSAWPKPTCTQTAGCPNGTNPGRTHRFYTGQPVLPFGFGLSYASFTYELLQPSPPSATTPHVSLQRLQAALDATASAARTFPSASALAAAADPPPIRFGVRVTNRGAAASDEVVLGFLVPPNAGLDGEPLQSLFGFERVHLLPGQSIDVWLTPSPMDFAHVDATGRFTPRPGTYTAHFGVEAASAHGGAFARGAPFEATLSSASPRTAPPSASRFVAPKATKRVSIAGKALYFVMPDRFARSGAAAANTTGCGGQGWCGGTITGVTTKLDYIAGMGFDCVWITPVVGQPAGAFGPSGTGYHGYWAEDWFAIDAHFGTPDDLRALSLALHERGMCLMLDIVTNHVRPIRGAADVAAVHPFNETAHYHTLRAARGESFDAYAQHPVSSLTAFGSGCGPGDYACPGGYDETQVLCGWFYDLADLDQSVPYVRAELLRWVHTMVSTYDVDALRLDTAPYMPMDFLAELQAAAGVEVIGEVTTSNLSYHVAFTRPPESGGGGLDGVLNFPMYYEIGQAFCGAPSAQGALFEAGSDDEAVAPPPSFLRLARVLSEQLTAGYTALDLLGSFVDNHDTDRIATTCRSSVARISSALAFVFAMRGVPIVYAGTEQGLAGDKNNHNRYSLWAGRGYDVSAPLYKLIRKLNNVRKAHLSGVGRESLPARVVRATNQTMILARGDALMLFVNNRARVPGSMAYCLPAPLPPLPRTHSWHDALSGVEATFGVAAECPLAYMASDGSPKLLVPMPAAAVPRGASTSALRRGALLTLAACGALVVARYLYHWARRTRDQRARDGGRGVRRTTDHRESRTSRKQQQQRLVHADGAVAIRSSTVVEISSFAADGEGRSISESEAAAIKAALHSPDAATTQLAPTHLGVAVL